MPRLLKREDGVITANQLMSLTSAEVDAIIVTGLVTGHQCAGITVSIKT